MDVSSGFIFIQLPPLLVIGATAASLVWWYREGALYRLVGGGLSSAAKVLCVLALAGVWLLLTLMSWWCLLWWAYLTVLAMYVLFGAAGGWAGLVGVGTLLVSAPVVWGVILFGLARREFRYASARPPVRALPPAGLRPV
jgi:hypothetical protein